MLAGGGTLDDTEGSALTVDNNPTFSGSLNVTQDSQVSILANSRSVSPLGTAVITLANGSNLDLSQGKANVSLSNKVFVGGNGGVTAANNNQYYGAVSLCGGTLTITGLVTLTSNTLFSGCEEGGFSSSVYLNGGLTSDGYSLTPQPNTLLSIIK